MASWWNILWESAVPGLGAVAEGTGAATGEGGTLTGAVTGLGDSLSFGKMVWLQLSDYRMWRSLGWLLLGILLMILGFVVWNRKTMLPNGIPGVPGLPVLS